jgi:hypothetical protein
VTEEKGMQKNLHSVGLVLMKMIIMADWLADRTSEPWWRPGKPHIHKVSLLCHSREEMSVLKKVNHVFLILGFWRHVDMLVDADVLEEHAVSIFQG